MGLPWLDSPVMLHSSRMDMCMLTDEQCAYRMGHWRYWYQADHVFGHATIYFMCATVGVFALVNLLSRVSRTPKGKGYIGNNFWHSIICNSRYLAYRTFYVRAFNWYSPPVGVMLLGIAGAGYFFSLTIGPQPYYWPNTKSPAVSYGGSPPIATRSGWMAVALLPFVMAAASKANYITALTGVSHEKLQVFHRWISWTMFVLALVHTFPFIVYNISFKEDMMEEWKTDLVYWTGVAALIPQAYLNIMSIGPIRNRYYEFFKSTHYIAIILFIFFFFIHCDFRLTSWDYFIATLSSYLTTLTYSFIRTIKNSISAKATLTILPDSTIQITIPTSRIKWQPGQHVFLRFWTLGLHSLTTHPFTICSVSESKNLVFFVKPHAGGFTSRLHALASQGKAPIPVSIDGPYGHTTVAQNLCSYEKVLLIAGGSGSGFLLPLLETVVKNTERAAKDIRVVLAVRTGDSVAWFTDAITAILGPEVLDGIKVEIYITDDPLSASKSHSQSSTSSRDGGRYDNDIEKVVSGSAVQVAESRAVTVISGQGRPDLEALILREVLSQRQVGNDEIENEDVKGRRGVGVSVAACGPSSMMLDVRNACAEAQMLILDPLGKGAREVYLHTEAFGW